MHGTAEDKAGVRPGSSWCRSDRVLICGNATRKFLILVIFYPVERAARAFAGVLLFWPGTDVLLDPGDEHGGIVSPGTVVRGDAHLANVLWHQGRLVALLDLEWARLGPPDLEFEAISRDDPDVHAQVLSLLLRCPSSSTGSTSPSESGSVTSCFQVRQ